MPANKDWVINKSTIHRLSSDFNKLRLIMSTVSSQHQDNFDDLLVSTASKPDKLNLLLAVCDDNVVRDHLIAQYEAEFDREIRCYRVVLPRDEPSMQLAITRLLKQEPYLQQRGKAVVTVTGADELRDHKRFWEIRSEQEVFFGYLQWTWEALQELPFAIVL
jgi:hypothetical protein